MKQLITAKLKLHTTPDQFQALRKTQLAYRDALNAVSRYAYEHGKISNQRTLQREMYDQIRLLYGLPAQMACNVPRQVGATYKALWTKAKQNAAHRKAGITRKRYKGLDKPPKYVSPTLTYNYQHDYSLKRDHQVSILTLDGRVIVSYTGYDKHVALLSHGAAIGAAKLWYDKPHQHFYLLLSLELEVADPTPETHRRCRCGAAVPSGDGYSIRTDRFLCGQSGTRQSRPLCSNPQTLAAQRHSFRYPTPCDHQWTRETVEAADEPYHRQAHCPAPPTQHHRS